MIEIRHLRKVFDDDTIPLKDIDITINDGDVISIIGPSLIVMSMSLSGMVSSSNTLT